MKRRPLVLWLGFLAVGGCKTSGALPGWDEGQPDQQVAAADPEATPNEPVDDEEVAEETEPATDQGTAGEPAPTSDTGEPTAAAEPAPAELPKALHTKINASCGKDPGVGQTLKAFSLKAPNGKTITNRSYGDRVLLVNFWGTWCEPCLKELPEFDQLYRRYRKHGLTMIAIATDEEAGPVQEFVDRRKLAAKVALGGEAYAGQYASPKFPFTFVVDPKGVIRASYRGYRPECMGKLEADIRAELEKR